MKVNQTNQTKKMIKMRLINNNCKIINNSNNNSSNNNLNNNNNYYRNSNRNNKNCKKLFVENFNLKRNDE